MAHARSHGNLFSLILSKSEETSPSPDVTENKAEAYNHLEITDVATEQSNDSVEFQSHKQSAGESIARASGLPCLRTFSYC